MENKKHINILFANILFLVLALVFLTVGAYYQKKDVYSGLLITEYIIILLPSLIYLKIRGFSFKKSLRLNAIKIRDAINIILITIFSYPIGVFLNLIILTVLNIFTELPPAGVPIPENTNQYIVSLFIIAISPGICEEVMFRGTMMDAYKSLGKKKAILYSSILFGLFHFNILNLLGPIFLGIVFGIMVYRTDSIYSAILGHITNNALALSLAYSLSRLQGAPKVDKIQASPSVIGMFITLTISGLIALASLNIVTNLIKKLPRRAIEEVEEEKDINEDKKPSKIYYFPIVISITIYILLNTRYLLS